jgi:hypothetical protein
MNARPAPPTAPRFDRKFIEEHQLLERYLEGKLPVKGARDLEQWCRSNPEYINELKLAERAQSSLKLLEACGKPVDLREPSTPWWRSVYLLIGLSVVTFLSLAAFWVLSGKYYGLQHRLEEARTVQTQGPLVQPTSESSVTVTPDRAPDVGRARIEVKRDVPQLIDIHIDLAYTEAKTPGALNNLAAKKVTTFRLVVDKKDQGRALIVNNLLKDSNNQLRLTLNTTGLSPGIYTVRIEGLAFGGGITPVGWMLLEVK